MRTVLKADLAGTAAGAEAERVLRACVHCGMCNATCPTYQLTGDELDGPRGRIYLIKQVLEGAAPTRVTQQHLDRCLTCRACETTCPSGVEYHALLDIGREQVAAQVRRSPPQRAFRWLLRQVAAFPTRFGAALALGRLARPLLPRAVAAKLPRRVDVAPAPVTSHARQMILLGGCVQPAAAPQINAAAARVFDRLGVGLAEAPGAGCCGALSFHLDAPEEARAHARRNLDAWRPMIEAGAEALVVTASGCTSFIRDYGRLLADDPAYADLAARVSAMAHDPVALLPERMQAVRAPDEPRIAVHDPCSLQHGLKLAGRVERLLRGLGYDPQPVRDAHLCCGSAGAYSLLQPAIAGQLRADKLEALTEHDPSAICTGNIGCLMHLGEKADVPVRHWIEAVDAVT